MIASEPSYPDLPAAVIAAVDWLLTEGKVARLGAYIEPWNIGRIRVAERAGFEREGLMRSLAPINGERVDAYLFAKIAEPKVEPA